jgi:AraC-like DNA-binding protein
VKEVAARVGYDSEAAFSTAFKRFHGVAPAIYRKQEIVLRGMAS